MNILMVSELYKFGGASEIMEVLAGQLKENGHHVTLLYGYNPGHYAIREPDHYVIFNNSYLRRVNNRLKPQMERYNLRNYYSYLYLLLLIKQKKIDIVHFHAMQGSFLYLRDIAGICREQRVIWTVHDTWPVTGGCMYYWDCDGWRDESCSNCSGDIELQMQYKNAAVNLQRKKDALLNKGVHFVAPSQWMLGNMQASCLKREKMDLIENGIDLQSFSPLGYIEDLKLKYGIDAHKKVLMFNSGDVKNQYKGWKYLRSALFQLRNPEEYELIIVGKEAKDIRNLSISNKKMGYVQSKKTLNELYNIADLFIVPSVQDNFPTVILEAQASGTPVLAFSIGGIKEQITEETGWLMDEISAESLRTGIEEIFNRKDWRYLVKKKGEMARKRCELLYDQKLMTLKYEKLYKKEYYAKNKTVL